MLETNSCGGCCFFKQRTMQNPIAAKNGIILALVASTLLMVVAALGAGASASITISPGITSLITGSALSLVILGVFLATKGCRAVTPGIKTGNPFEEKSDS